MTQTELSRNARYACAVEITVPSLWARLVRFIRGSSDSAAPLLRHVPHLPSFRAWGAVQLLQAWRDASARVQF